MYEEGKGLKTVRTSGNVLAKAQRLAIDIPDDDTDEQTAPKDSLLQYGKNSPSHDRVKGFSEGKREGDLTPNQRARAQAKEVAPASARTAKGRVFQFPQKSSTPRAAGQAPHIFPIQSSPLLHKGTIKPLAVLRPKQAGSRTPKTQGDSIAISPPSAGKGVSLPATPGTASPRARTESKPQLKGLITQVAQSSGAKAQPRDGASPQEIKTRADAIYREHLFQTFQAMKFVRNLPMADSAQLRAKRLTLAKPPGYANRKTAVFDLDETLVHCCDSVEGATPDVVLPITFPSGEVVNAGINIRPYARECLQETAKEFEIVIFTASHRCYADVVLDYLDPEHAFVHHRLYRENCIITEGVFLKDLRILANRSLKDIVIVDNAAYSFGYQVDNGVPIISWHDDPYDRELFNLIDYLKALSKAEDIREVNRLTFHLASFYEDYIEEFMAKERKSPRTRQ